MFYNNFLTQLSATSLTMTNIRGQKILWQLSIDHDFVIQTYLPNFQPVGIFPGFEHWANCFICIYVFCIATPGSILDSQLCWNFSKFQSGMIMYVGPTHPPDLLSILSDCRWECNFMGLSLVVSGGCLESV